MGILPSTLRALQARDATIYRVTVGAYTIKRGALTQRAEYVHPERDFHQPEHSQLFADKRGAMRYALTFDQFAPLGVPAAIISPVRARDYDALTCTPLESAA